MRSLHLPDSSWVARAALGVLLIPVMGASLDRRPEWRAIDGSDNNTINPTRGKAGMPLLRTTGHAYADAISEPSGPRRPSARAVSNAVAVQTEDAYVANGASDYVWLWGQFLDHDISLTPGHDPAEPLDIEVPAGDPWFDPAGTGTQKIGLSRSIYDPRTGTRRSNPRRQLNMITSWHDASNVYGSDTQRARALRRNKGNGLLKTSPGRLLPYNKKGLDNAGGPNPSLFLAGDVRANEQVSLTAMHTEVDPILWTGLRRS